MKFLKRPRPGARGPSGNHTQSSGLVELASGGPTGFGSGRNNGGVNSRREPLVGAVGAELETNTRAGTQQKHPAIDGQHNPYHHSMPPQSLLPGERITPPTSGGTFTDEDEGNNIDSDGNDDDDDEYSRYSSNYLADHNRNLHENAALTDAKYAPPSPGGRRSAAGASYDRNRSMSDYTAPFDDTEEWTPDDSAYGAACPVFGWIPKPMRKVIEATFIFVLVLIFVVVVISASIKMSNDKNGNKTGKWNGSGSGGGGSKWYTDDAVSNNINDKNGQENGQQGVDDDYYVERDGENDDNTDDYLNGDNNGGGANNNGGRGRLLLRRNHVVLNEVLLQRGGGAKERDSTLGNGELLGRRVGKAYLW